MRKSSRTVYVWDEQDIRNLVANDLRNAEDIEIRTAEISLFRTTDGKIVARVDYDMNEIDEGIGRYDKEADDL